ncbi:hypothetical protein WEU38_16465 [Cyanobacterium aponinum AL20118]|uniref:Alpha/beta hydrolase n=1 Tax=Cyanobacterium aponinum AL20115 TaxID=3090662 RepID=A0AAF0ZDR3_9CHRO|nr:hypothetical protein [Cyanobacterium aponinum]WPF88385.1 hypothetical protein SAY89_16545 [Cyanobacterium aponinum AL20115]
MSNQQPLIVIIGGFHNLEITTNFINYLYSQIKAIKDLKYIIIPTDKVQPLDGLSAYNFLSNYLVNQSCFPCPIIVISFSAGVVGAIILGKLWKARNGEVLCLLAFDGWGVPLIADFPCYRVSHDHFTHFSSLLLGGEESSFYAQPMVNHLELWRSPLEIQGRWQMKLGVEKTVKMTDFIQFCLQKEIDKYIKKCKKYSETEAKNNHKKNN